MARLDGYTTHGIYYTADDRDVLKKRGVAMSEQVDDLDAYIAKRAARNPAFPAMVDAALKERRLLRELAAKRVEMGLSQKTVAARMGTTPGAGPVGAR